MWLTCAPKSIQRGRDRTLCSTRRCACSGKQTNDARANINFRLRNLPLSCTAQADEWQSDERRTWLKVRYFCSLAWNNFVGAMQIVKQVWGRRRRAGCEVGTAVPRSNSTRVSCTWCMN